eukprot:CAMPEP_0201127528 /NCGR_PEP_ID=MMETSP0850-20130426/30614_1 /ASSEMBLY_ACC=CAM_ASM_000622 /TAXON_ID=183588 /ORGANISM="Pseudo-nitzschia fraudulenta, Strain WWA7" /LENGTH=109 /DNA_ID=CAMNT_0047396415 /DNA_START=40 /DNA_END=368 /DNA_ORIENTATION=+
MTYSPSGSSVRLLLPFVGSGSCLFITPFFFSVVAVVVTAASTPTKISDPPRIPRSDDEIALRSRYKVGIVGMEESQVPEGCGDVNNIHEVVSMIENPHGSLEEGHYGTG